MTSVQTDDEQTTTSGAEIVDQIRKSWNKKVQQVNPLKEGLERKFSVTKKCLTLKIMSHAIVTIRWLTCTANSITNR